MFEVIGLGVLLVFTLFWFFSVRRTTKFGAPFVALEPEVVERVMNLVDLKPGEVFYDLGSGDGRLVIAAALRGAQVYGVEIDFLRAWYSRIWLKLLRLKNAQIIRKNIFTVDLSNANVVCLYLLQETNEKIQAKLKKELKPGARIVSVAFDFPGWKPETVDPRGTIYGPIYLYKV